MHDTLAEPRFLDDLWNEDQAAQLIAQPIELLRYRSNLLGADLRITNFGGGNTSSKFELPDPLTGEPTRVLAVKGSGGDLRSITTSGFAVLYLDKLEALIQRYRGEAHEDEMVALYPLCACGENRVAASIDTPLHAFLPFAHVDHLHPDWAIALAASANGEKKLAEFNAAYGRHLHWIPWQRPGFELALMLRKAVAGDPACDGIILGGHGLFTWGRTPRDCYANSIRTIDQMGDFIDQHRRRGCQVPFGGVAVTATVDRQTVAVQVLPFLRGVVSSNRRVVAHWVDSEDALAFANSRWAEDLSALGTSCPDHFLRTRICPMFVPWDPSSSSVADLLRLIAEHATTYREGYAAYYQTFADADSPRLRDSNPSVVVIPALGVFGFASDAREARITAEFFVNAIHVMDGATVLADTDSPLGAVPQARRPEQARDFAQAHNYVALPRREAFRIEYWALEEAKLLRMPPEREFGRKVVLVVGGASGIGRDVVVEIAKRGGHVVAADRDLRAAEETVTTALPAVSADKVMALELDLASRQSIRSALRRVVLRFGGLDCLINTAAIYPTPDSTTPPETVWSQAMAINVASNHVLAQEVAAIFRAQNLPASVVLTSSANAVVAKHGSEPYDVSKAAINHLIRELAIGLGPNIRVNGIAPATVVAGSSMFPRERVMASLRKYEIEFSEEEGSERLRDKLAQFYAQRTITHRPVLPSDCANAICWLAGEQSAKTTGHIIPVDGGLPEAFLR